MTQQQPQQNESIIISDKNNKKYNDAKHEFRTYYRLGIKFMEEAKKRINIMVSILHDEHPEWSVSRIASQISIENEDIGAFSRTTIYRSLDETKRC